MIQDAHVLVGPTKERLDIKVALSNSFGFGGHNSSILFAPYKQNFLCLYRDENDARGTCLKILLGKRCTRRQLLRHTTFIFSDKRGTFLSNQHLFRVCFFPEMNIPVRGEQPYSLCQMKSLGQFIGRGSVVFFRIMSVVCLATEGIISAVFLFSLFLCQNGIKAYSKI